ncbi:hypothetical protein RGF97_23640 [Streptomyces roseicoloratus]|uniref:Integral membrane protein n=1 Tax=Streptomyces roseicoloratus TaxID=2508722 RepID=A0ABY9RYZ6_9ACTN|nr:hypothetical protein [Streptomyces roseicoloratus]WMX47207.1 hypothetical protein RGF97_23640 [Streptomyces roseicoloratus]
MQQPNTPEPPSEPTEAPEATRPTEPTKAREPAEVTEPTETTGPTEPTGLAQATGTPAEPDARTTGGGWVAPLVSTVITLPAGFLALINAMLSPMACDPCGPAESRRFTESFLPAFWVFAGGLVLSLAFLTTSWFLPRRVRHTARRMGFAAAAPLTVLVSVVIFNAMVDWPR